MMTVGGWQQLTPVARFLVYVLRDYHDQGVMLVSSEQIMTAMGLPVDALKAAAVVARDTRFIEKVDGGIRLTALVCMETALATRPTLRKVKDEGKLPPGFLRLWQISPRGAARAEAIREFVKLSPDEALAGPHGAALRAGHLALGGRGAGAGQDAASADVATRAVLGRRGSGGGVGAGHG